MSSDRFLYIITGAFPSEWEEFISQNGGPTVTIYSRWHPNASQISSRDEFIVDEETSHNIDVTIKDEKVTETAAKKVLAYVNDCPPANISIVEQGVVQAY